MAYNISIIETFALNADLKWDDQWLQIIDFSDPRKGELDYEQESFRQSYNNYLRGIALQAESVEADILTATMRGMMSASPDSDPWFHPSYDSLSDCSEY